MWRDLLERRGRSLLVVIAMAAGIFQIAAMLYKYALLQPELTTMYGRTHPASATITLDRVSDALIDSVRRLPGVAVAEARPVIVARARVGDEWVPAVLYVVRDFDDQRIDTFAPEAGDWPPGEGEVLLERSALRVAKVVVGDRLRVRTTGGEETTLRVAGTAYAAGMAPAWMEHSVPGFVGWRSSLRGTETAQIRIVAEHPLDEGFIREVADSTRAMLERQGHTVGRIDVPNPGRHPHADQMEAFLFLLLSFGILSFTLSAVLVASMIHGLMSEQLRQVGVMKAIGARDGQIAGIYLGQVGILAAAALVLGIPPGLIAGGAYARFAAGILNADVSHAPFPLWVVPVVVVAGFAVPLLFALGPVHRAAGVTVQRALHDDPVAPRARRGPERFAWLSRPLRWSLRTTFARRGRLALTVGTLAMGGAAFISALNVSSAWTRAVDADFARRRYDLTVTLAERWPTATLDAALAAVPGVERAEYWPGASPYLIGVNGVASQPVSLVGPTPGSTLLDPRVVAGRWLRSDDTEGAVINGAVVNRNPGLALGDTVRVRLRGRTVGFPIVGVVKELAPMPVVYAASSAVLAATGQSGDESRVIRVVTRAHDDAGQRSAAREIEQAFDERGIEVTGVHRMLDQRQGILDHLVIILTLLTVASLVVVFVGGIGLAGTLTLNVIQRTREIGILGAIGATPGTIARQIWIEALVIGVLSWVAALILAAPISYALEAACGRIFFKAPLDFHLSPGAAGIWFALVVVLASLSSFFPARRAARLTVREAMSHT